MKKQPIFVRYDDGYTSKWWAGPKPTGEVYVDVTRGAFVFEWAFNIIAGATGTSDLATNAANYIEQVLQLAKAAEANAAKRGETNVVNDSCLSETT